MGPGAPPGDMTNSVSRLDRRELLLTVGGATALSALPSAATGTSRGEAAAGAAREEATHAVVQDGTCTPVVALSGDDPVTLPILGIGGTGVISVAGNVIPEQVCELVGAALDGDYEHARDRHHELGPLFRAMFAETNPIPVKEALKMRGYGNAHFRPPLTPAEDEIRDDLRVLLDGVL